jgi:hypothetical protein
MKEEGRSYPADRWTSKLLKLVPNNATPYRLTRTTLLDGECQRDGSLRGRNGHLYWYRSGHALLLAHSFWLA